MLIGIDTFGCNHGRSGSGSYLVSLLKNVSPVKDCEIELFGLETDRYLYDSGKNTDSFVGLPVYDSLFAEKLWHFFSLRKFIRKRKYDVVLFPASMSFLPIVKKVPAVLVVNDLIEKSSKHRVKHCLKKAAAIIAASQYIKKEIVSLGIDSSKVEVIHDGVDQNLFFPRQNYNGDVVLIQPFAIKRPYIIYPSSIRHPEKKHVELIKAYNLFRQKTGLACKLVLAGSESISADIVQKAVLESPYSSDIILTGYFPHQNLPKLYDCSDACIMPSVVEGFGLPDLEAMACGVPVMCAKAGALPEIAGNAAAFFDADNTEQTAAVIEQVLTDENLRKKLIDSGTERVKHFSWVKTAERTMELIKNVAAQK